MALVISLFLLLASAFGGFHATVATRSPQHLADRPIHAAQHGFTPSGSGPVGSPQP
jgi:hypothetical protein